MRRLLELIRQEFIQRIEQKTGWGKNELILEFEHALSDAMAKYLDEKEDISDK